MQLEYRDFERILKIGIKLSTEKNRDSILETILESGMKITNCDAGTLYLLEDDHLSFYIMKTISLGISQGKNEASVLQIPAVPMREENVCAYAAIHREIVNIADVYESDRFDFVGPQKYDEMTGYHTKSLLVIPIENCEKELFGVLQLINAKDEKGEIVPFDEQYDLIIRSLGSMAAIELTNISYTEKIKKLLYSFVEAFATAVDERIPYNGSHTRRVAKYAGILVDYINKKHEEGETVEYFDEERKEKLILAALLHDIGKMIIPSKTMNRPTRLDKDLDKIEKRFELLAAYYEIDMLKGRITKEEFKEKTEGLKKDLAYIKEINDISYIDDEKYEKLVRIFEEKYVKEDGTVIPYLSENEIKYLRVRKGTLSEEDRKLVESHVEKTEKILSKVEFDKNYIMIPRWAASHHEFLNGTGYPRKLKGDEIDIETRILTIADIYEALTASDRPYKKPMPKNKAFGILYEMAEEGKLEIRLVNWLEKALSEEDEND